MNAFFTSVRETVVPNRDAGSRHGPLPLLLIGLTFVTGLIDAFSYLVLGRVFVANMTGNVVFLGFGAAGAPGFSIAASLVALAAFIVGAVLGGRLAVHRGGHRGHLLVIAVSMEAVLVAVAAAIAIVSPSAPESPGSYAQIIGLGVGMGLQNAAVRKLGVPDLTTTVLTLTITALAAESRPGGGSGTMDGRRVVAIVVMLAGAAIGAWCVVHARPEYPLLVALVVLVVLAVATWRWGAQHPRWTQP